MLQYYFKLVKYYKQRSSRDRKRVGNACITHFILYGPVNGRYYLCVQPTFLIDPKVMLYPSPNNLHNPRYYLVIDPADVNFSHVNLPL